MAGIDDYLCSMLGLRQLQICVSLLCGPDDTDRVLFWRLIEDKGATVRLVRMAFGKCAAKGILSIRVTQELRADFTDGED